MTIPIYEISLPEYTVDAEPDDKALGKLLDDEVKKYFLGRPILLRGVASSEHPNKTQDELIEIIRQTGTDRYDPDRKGDRYENIEGKHIDLFAFPATYTAQTELMHYLFWGFYHSSIGIHGYPMKIDIVSIYDATQLDQVLHQYAGRDDVKDDGFAFKQPDNKAQALLGIIKVT